MGSPTNDREETLFLRVLGIKSPVLRILEFLMDNKVYDYSKTDIAKGAELAEEHCHLSGRTWRRMGWQKKRAK